LGELGHTTRKLGSVGFNEGTKEVTLAVCSKIKRIELRISPQRHHLLAFQPMDAIDRAILHQLQHDGRMANNELADRVGLSASPCLRRVRQLETDGVIVGYAALVDRVAVNRSYEPMVWVTLTEITRKSMTEFEDAASAIPDVVEVLRMMGQPDYLLRIVSANATEFESLYIDQLAALPYVQTLTSQLAMKVIKRTHHLPLT
jgi:Lrp/AsnC family transcriptional regulator, leucine-responsive regulatory protein